jgi:hypothetical protein
MKCLQKEHGSFIGSGFHKVEPSRKSNVNSNNEFPLPKLFVGDN